MTEVESFSIYSSEDECVDGQEPKLDLDPRLIAKLYCKVKEKKTLNLDWKSAG